MNTRRSFLIGSAGAALASSRIMGANDRIRAGMIGLGKRALKLQTFLSARNDIDIVAICDVWDRRTQEFQPKIGRAHV